MTYKGIGEYRAITLTTGTDAGPDFTGGNSDDTFNAPLDLGIDGLVAVQTLQGSDVLDGGAGTDKLVAELNGTGTTANPRLSNIEILELTSFTGGGPGMLDLSRSSGVEQIWNIDSRNDLGVFDVNAPVLIGLDGVRGGNEFYVEYDADVVFETQDVVATNVGSPGSGPVGLGIWMGNLEYLETLNLEVSNGVYLYLFEDGNWIENLNISGSGPLVLTGEDVFPRLINLDSTGYNEDLVIDVSGSAVLESVLTGDGDDAVTVNRQAVNGSFTADLGEGDNTLVVVHVNGTLPAGPNNMMTGARINLLDFSGQNVEDLEGPAIQNVQTLAFSQITGLAVDATLDLTGFDDSLTTFAVADFDANGNDFTILAAPENFLITAAQEFDMNGGLFTIEGAVNLTVESTGEGDSDVDLNGGVNSTTLETLVVNASALSDGADADVYLDGGLDALVSVEVNAPGNDADLEIQNASGEEFEALENVRVTAADDARLVINGNDGVVGVPGTPQTQQITINVTGAGGGIPLSSTSSGNITFTSTSLPGGIATIPYSTTLFLLGNGNALHDAGAAADVAAWLNANAPGINATAAGNVVTVTWDGFEPVDGLVYQNGLSNATSGSLDSVSAGAVAAPVAPIEEELGTGFEALETVSVEAGDEADVELEDVYGAFELDVTADSFADVSLFNTGATTATVAVGTSVVYDPDPITSEPIGFLSIDEAWVEIDGDIYGNADLADLTVTGAFADIILAGGLDSFRELDVTGVTTQLFVDASGAEFVLGAGQYVTYLIGGTSNEVDAYVDVEFAGNAAREVYNFVGDDIGEVVINGFTAGSDPATGDRLDLSQFGINSAGALIFTVDGADLVITDLGADDFSGSITLVGLGAQADDVANFNIIYA